MYDPKLILAQKIKRNECLDNILNSKASRKIIVAGPGTGKTYTFCQILKNNNSNNNLVMTFMRKLVEDMQGDFGEYAEVKTFRAYCKKILHEINGKVELIPYLSQVIKKDSELLGMNYNNFDAKFQTFDEDSPAIKFYLDRGDYYEVVSFNDSVYRLYKILQRDNSIIPHFDQILIDEFQDFNSLEVAFITEMEKKGSILIVGDDDQAVYSGRSSSPNHLREKYCSGEYEIFELPFCSRCPKVIIEAINAFILEVQKNGHLNERINCRYEAYLEGKEYENEKYSKIITAQLSNIKIIPKYLFTEI
ncbi:MAG: UvrD-helicase domain-containing protein [Candidatus Hodarchaeota archaeon]